MSDYRINVYENMYDGEDKKVIARVRYNSILDYWDGHNWTNGGTGMHKGLTKLKDGRYVLIIGSNWVGSTDEGFIISKEDALQEILKSTNTELLDLKKWKELKELYSSTLLNEEEYEEEEE